MYGHDELLLPRPVNVCLIYIHVVYTHTGNYTYIENHIRVYGHDGLLLPRPVDIALVLIKFSINIYRKSYIHYGSYTYVWARRILAAEACGRFHSTDSFRIKLYRKLYIDMSFVCIANHTRMYGHDKLLPRPMDVLIVKIHLVYDINSKSHIYASYVYIISNMYYISKVRTCAHDELLLPQGVLILF